jgi:uncharacterized protein (TIGR03790 family)
MRRATAIALMLVAVTARALCAQSAANVLLVVNEASSTSVQIGEYYARKRALPSTNLLRIRAPIAEEIGRVAYEELVERPIAARLTSRGAEDYILYIVLTKDVPLRVAGSTGMSGTVASVDSELTLLYRKLVGRAVPAAGRVDNPYFAAAPDGSSIKPFTHAVADIYLVTRLDGFSVAEVTALIDRGLAPAKGGKIVLDEKGTGIDRAGDRWLEHTAEVLSAKGFDNVLLERTTALAGHQAGVMGYYSWGSNDPAFKSRRIDLDFVPGAIAATFVSTDGRTFHEPPAGWQISHEWSDRTKWFEGSSQSLTGDLIRAGVTGVAGHVAEPYLDGTIRPYILFPAYAAGMNLAEAFYLAMPYLSWQTIVVGDPLCAPFRTSRLTDADIDKGPDPVTELPRVFSERRVAQLAANGGSVDALRQLLKAETRLQLHDRAGARTALEQALKIDPGLVSADKALADLDELEGRQEEALKRYQRVVERLPNDALMLNNLAYSLATHGGKPGEAMPYAQRAAKLAPTNVSVLDTLGWVCHLIGDDKAADAALQQARQFHPTAADVWIHSAVVHLALGQPASAEQDLAAALKIDPAVEKRADYGNVRAKLKQRQPSK